MYITMQVLISRFVPVDFLLPRKVCQVRVMYSKYQIGLKFRTYGGYTFFYSG
jgi:hypothetical protein